MNRRIRLSNLNFVCGLPFRFLEKLDFVDYREDTPQENSRLLHENQLDVALIAPDEYARHGGYVGLDFGIGAMERIDSALVCAHRPIHELKRIYIDLGASSTATLLRLMLRDKWGISPQLVRTRMGDLSHLIDTHSGALLVGNHALLNGANFKIKEDLAAAWYGLTGLPFVFAVWAVRPGALTREQLLRLNEVFHVSVKARALSVENERFPQVFTGQNIADYLSETVLFKMDSELELGLNEFFDRCTRSRLLPKTSYRRATYFLLGGETKANFKFESKQVLSKLLDGARISVQEGLTLAEEANLSDLGVAAELLRKRIDIRRGLRLVLNPGDCDLDQVSEVKNSIQKLLLAGVSDLRIEIRDYKTFDLARIESFMMDLKSSFGVGISGLSAIEILDLAEEGGFGVDEVVSRLVTAGLDIVPGFGDELLIDHRLKAAGVKYTANQILQVYTLLHKYGARSSLAMVVRSGDTWEERFVHLLKFKLLQDETPGFICFRPNFVDPSCSSDLKLRVVALSRLFLDNVPYVQLNKIGCNAFESVVALNFGANQARVDLGSPEFEAEFNLVKSMMEIGMDFETSAIRATDRLVIN